MESFHTHVRTVMSIAQLRTMEVENISLSEKSNQIRVQMDLNKKVKSLKKATFPQNDEGNTSPVPKKPIRTATTTRKEEGRNIQPEAYARK